MENQKTITDQKRLKPVSLTDTAIRNVKPGTKDYKIYDGRGLFLIVKATGGKWWRFRYAFAGKEKLLSLGTYPDVSLKEAREKRDEHRKNLAKGIDPAAMRKAERTADDALSANSFEMIAREWFEKFRQNWAESHSERIIRRFERDIFPWIGGRPITEVTAPELLTAIRRIEARGSLETAHRALGNCGQVFRYAIATGRADRDPTFRLHEALPPSKEGHLAAVTDPVQVGELLRTFDGYRGSPIVAAALCLAPLVFVRPGELRMAEWACIDLDGAEWRFLISKTKTDLIVPLSRQAVGILREIQPLTGRGQYVFPSARTDSRTVSHNFSLFPQGGEAD